ncbi:MAG: YraN family protein [Chitinophagaceae bacterium]
MTIKQERGLMGERLAQKFVEEMGFQVLHTNWRHKHLEVDIIAGRAECLHIIEVKTQLGSTAGYPEENVDRKKLMNLIRAAERYLSADRRWKRMQIDVLAITLHDDEAEYFYIEDVYL